MASSRSVQKFLFFILVLALAFAPLGSTGPAIAKSGVYRYANGISVPGGTPLPIFDISSIPVSKEGTLSLSTVFLGINDGTNTNVQPDKYIGHDRFTVLNQKNNTIMEQYSATGGFYAFEPTRAFGDGSVVPTPELDPNKAKLLACQFILNHSADLVLPSNYLQIPGLSVKCDYPFASDPLYKASIETRSGHSTSTGDKTPEQLRIMATVPILVNTGLRAAPTIPLSGPGGHISMIFDTTNQTSTGPSLDRAIKGLQAVAMPAFGRSLTFNNRTAPAVDPAAAVNQVTELVKASYPTGNVQVPQPSLAYFMSDAAMPQTLLEPDLFFDGVTVEVDGHTIVLKQIVLPGVVGLGPTVTISSPKNGDVHFSGSPVTLAGSISDGTAPYDYQWQLDDGTPIITGTLQTAGTLPPVNLNLPLPDSKGAPGSQDIHLVVTDGENVTREAVVSLTTPLSLFLPLVGDQATGTTSAPAASAQESILATNAINYRFGVEYGSDYPPYGPGGSDLSGVPPDANGLSSGLMGLGWPRVFNWYNASAWEKDWRDCSLGGGDCTYGVDRADFVYYSGHGSNGGISVPSNSHDSSWFDGINARYQYARWVGFSSCLTLRVQGFTAPNEPIRRWFGAFKGAHMLLGFNSLMADIAFGPRLVDNMRIPTFPFIGEFPWAQRTIAQAWVQTAFEMNAGKPAYIYATSTTVDPVNNKLPKVGDPLLPRPYPVNWFYWVWWNE